MKEIKREDLKVGDEVCILIPLRLGVECFRYCKMKLVKIEKISPKQTKIIASGIEFDRQEKFYKIDDDVLYKNSVAKSIENIPDKIYQIYRGKSEIARLEDKDIIQLSHFLDLAFNVMKGVIE